MNGLRATNTTSIQEPRGNVANHSKQSTGNYLQEALKICK